MGIFYIVRANVNYEGAISEFLVSESDVTPTLEKLSMARDWDYLEVVGPAKLGDDLTKLPAQRYGRTPEFIAAINREHIKEALKTLRS